MRALAVKTGWAVVGVDYPRAPETPYPEPIKACASVIGTVMRIGPRLGLPEPLALMRRLLWRKSRRCRDLADA